MRFIHTADWHLGHKLHNQSRHEEHKVFLDWLVDQSLEHDIDALLIAGDVFDTPNPPAEALKLLYQFFHRLHNEAPHVQVVMIGGNHDSAHRLEAPQLLLNAFNVHVIGGMPPQNALDFERLFIPVKNRAGERRAWVVAVPYLRPSDLPNFAPRPNNYLIEGVREVYRVALEHVATKREEGEGVIVMGHCYMASSKLSEDSERKILGNHQNALPVDLFPMDVSYVALGHLHLAQALNGVEKIRYSGSPLPLSLTERHYKHQVALIELSDELEQREGHDEPIQCVHFKSFTPLYTPRGVEMIRIPDQSGAGVPVEEALAQLRALPERDPDVPQWARPFLHVSVTIEETMPHLKALVFEAMQNKHARLSRLQVIRLNKPEGEGMPSLPAHHLSELTHERVFKLKWSRENPNKPLPDEVLDAFNTLLTELHEQQDDSASTGGDA